MPRRQAPVFDCSEGKGRDSDSNCAYCGAKCHGVASIPISRVPDGDKLLLNLEIWLISLTVITFDLDILLGEDL